MRGTVELTMMTKSECHLCDDVRGVVDAVIADFATSAHAPEVVFSERLIDDDAELTQRYGEQVPVLLINGRRHSRWFAHHDRLATALLSARNDAGRSIA